MVDTKEYNYEFSLRVGKVVSVHGVPCEHLGLGAFGTNTYPGKPAVAPQEIKEVDFAKLQEDCDHIYGTDGMHSNEYCKKCFKSKPED